MVETVTGHILVLPLATGPTFLKTEMLGVKHSSPPTQLTCLISAPSEARHTKRSRSPNNFIYEPSPRNTHIYTGLRYRGGSEHHQR